MNIVSTIEWTVAQYTVQQLRSIPFLIIGIILSFIPSSLPLQSGISHWDHSPTTCVFI
jgi:hypothetical protein